ncbi:MAG: cupin domain-containing protein [Parachlamydia sp.]|jgi:oxalate decarboxylase|nr:cupin domain-containing protein [Parachlamydia sp.]
MSTHIFHLNSTEAQQGNAFGSRIDATQANFPVLKGMALSYLTLEKQGVREPHWHPNAHELSYCLEGKALMTVFSPGSVHETFVIEPGSLAFVPMGSIHHIENIGAVPFKMVICFNHELPEEINLSSSIAVMPATILGDTFHMNPSFFTDLHAKVQPTFISQMSENPADRLSWMTNRLKMAIDGTQPEINNRGGWVKMSNSFLMPSLEGLAMYSLLLEPKGAREPHWHPNAHELNYLISGQARITLLSLGERVETFDMKAGDMSFLPKGYLHHIENTGDEPARFAIFFNHTAPSDIGISGCLGAYSNEVLASLFKVPVEAFDKLPKFQQDVFVVSGGG